MDPVNRLVAAEEIRKTKATYWYTLDMKDWNGFGNCFTDDAILDLREEGYFAQKKPIPSLPSAEEALAAGDPAVTVGGKAFAARVGGALASWKTVHHGHAPIIEVESEDEASAIWPLFDYIENAKHSLQAYGHYHERYRRQPNGRWLISRMRLTRLRGDGSHPMLGE